MVRLKCFHGTSYENGQSILKEKHFRTSDSDSLRMGEGAYFFCQAGESDAYPIRCAKELEAYHRSMGKHKKGFAILSCVIECEDENYLDLYDPESLEYFHQMRYMMLDKSMQVDPEFRYRNAAVADTQVFDVIRKIRPLTVIRCPQFFGMLDKEMKFNFDKRERQFPKTYVPNVIMVCADTNKVVVKDIELVEGRVLGDEYERVV